VKARLSDLEDFANTFVNRAIHSAFSNDLQAGRSVNRAIGVRREASA
jgi:hypothetical protein